MIPSEKLLKDLNLRLAHFGDPEIASKGSPLPHSTPKPDIHRIQREIIAKLVFKTE